MNAIIMLFVKGLSVFLQLALLPLTVSYVSSSTYGIWLSLSSIVAWISFFDIGINNGLKNRYVQAVAANDYDKAKRLVSTTYAFLISIFVPVALLLLFLNQHLDWNEILNVESDDSISKVVSVIILYFSSNFIFSTVNVIMTAEQKPAYASVINFIQQLLTLIVIWILTICTEGSLLNLCYALCLPPLSVLVSYNFFIFSGKYKIIAPSLNAIDISLIKDLLSLGFKFFLIQISVILLYQTSSFIMIRYYGPDAVTQYNVAYKYFFSLNMIFSIIIAPIWAAVTDALAKGEIKWIQNIFRKYIKLLLLFLIVSFLMLLICNKVYDFWMGDAIKDIEIELSLCVCLYVCITMCGSLMATFLNGAGYLKLQFINCIIAPIIFFVLCWMFIKQFNWGIYSIPLSIIISSFYSYIISPLQCYFVFFQGKKGIWCK